MNWEDNSGKRSKYLYALHKGASLSISTCRDPYVEGRNLRVNFSGSIGGFDVSRMAYCKTVFEAQEIAFEMTKLYDELGGK